MEQFTQRARRVLSLAQEEAERMQHSYIGTEHMLIGLMREEGGVAGRVLHDLGVDQRRVEELVDRLTYTQQRPPSKQLVLSADTLGRVAVRIGWAGSHGRPAGSYRDVDRRGNDAGAGAAEIHECANSGVQIR